MVFRVVPLDPARDRRQFRSGTEALDRYFRERVTQDIRRRVTSCYVALDEQNRARGFYTLASTSVLLGDLPQAVAKRLPRYPSVPAIRMGRLAVDQVVRGQGLGAALLADALARSANAEIAAYALVVDAKDDQAAAFYKHHGFLPIINLERTLFLPLATAKRSHP
ncbi:MAG: GNAT family N-acetyltransferase [Pseudomonadota bacterium]|nr:GNAT family N-acetyltransferase [Pseudomonadota bacterium]